MAIIINVQTRKHTEMLNITRQIAERIPADFNGACLAFCMHTTAGLTINENADPDVCGDMLDELERQFPWNRAQYKHVEGNSAGHLKSSLVGPSQLLPVENGILQLGTWQGVYLCEFDGPRQRRVLLKLLPGLK